MEAVMTRNELKDIIKECYIEIKNDNESITESALSIIKFIYKSIKKLMIFLKNCINKIKNFINHIRNMIHYGLNYKKNNNKIKKEVDELENMNKKLNNIKNTFEENYDKCETLLHRKKMLDEDKNNLVNIYNDKFKGSDASRTKFKEFISNRSEKRVNEYKEEYNLLKDSTNEKVREYNALAKKVRDKQEHIKNMSIIDKSTYESPGYNDDYHRFKSLISKNIKDFDELQEF